MSLGCQSRTARRLLIAAVLLVMSAGGARAVGQTRDGAFAGAGGAAIAYRAAVVPDAVGAVLLLTGYTESYLYYDELIADLRARRYSVYAMDHRGMGLSSRLAANPQIVHVERFSDYVDDAEAFVAGVVRAEWSGPLYFFGHSTGALVGAELLARRPAWFAAAALSSPLFDVNTGNVPRFVAASAASAATALGLGARYAPGYGDVGMDSRRFETNKVTHSRERWDAHEQVLRAHPELLMGGPSNRWVEVVLAETESVEALARQVTTPVVVFQAGEDHFVRNPPQETFCRLTTSCRLVRFDAAFHELVRELDPVRSALMDETLRHFAAHAR
jgi:lysophospholipase